jgi:hypothetical protein
MLDFFVSVCAMIVDGSDGGRTDERIPSANGITGSSVLKSQVSLSNMIILII